jgi:2-polyprenyl-3-methyl-5-hydroxy-6-metoxy-1,4-benzoquinol methylase
MNMPTNESPELHRLSELGWHPATTHELDGRLRVVKASVVDYPLNGLQALAHGGAGYWFDHRARCVVDALINTTDARTIWDVGAGTGAMSVRLADAGFDVIAVEPLLEGATAIAHGGSVTAFCSTLADLDLPGNSLPIIGLFDVIEHLADPGVLLAEVRRVLEVGGVTVITVPAFKALWSREDEIAGHHRRYTRVGLDDVMREAGYRVVRSEYLFASLIPAALMLRSLPYRLGSRRSAEQIHTTTAKRLAPRSSLDGFARRVMNAEFTIARHVRLPAGLSILGIYAAAHE